MIGQAILPYYHPTTVVIVDDNDLFLHTLDLRMPPEMAYLLFHDARVALERVNQPSALPPLSERCLSAISSAGGSRSAIVHLDVGLIEEEVKFAGRFSRTSVVIVDYAMPEMNGLEFCRGIQDPTIKKVLLTGVADEKLAVKAFNEGAIDRFISKSANGTLDLVVTYAKDLQRAYFVEQQRAFSESLALSPPGFLSDRALSAHFDALRDRLGIVEYYLVGDPPGFLMVTSGGKVRRLVVGGDAEVDAQVAFARRHGAPEDVVAQIGDRRALGCFLEEPDPLAETPFPWREYLHEAHRVEGSLQNWYIALVRDVPNDVDFDPRASSFDTHLDRMDHLALA